MSTAPSERELPKTVDARKLAGQGVLLTGFYQCDQLPRLADAVLDMSEPVSVELNFSADQQHTRTVSGVVGTRVVVTCERCMGKLVLPLRAEVAVGLVWDEEDAQRLRKDLDPWIVADESAHLSGLVEDELLLVLPYVNYHDQGECQGLSSFSTGEIEEQEQPNPFQVLEQLKSKD